MIRYVKGSLAHIDIDHIIIEVNGIGYRVFVSALTRSQLGSLQSEVKLFTHFVVREDQQSLFGFLSIEDLQLYELLIGVNGVGPKVGMGLMGVMTAAQLQQAIVTENLSLLTKIPGVGKKTAQRLIIELKDKLAKVTVVDDTALVVDSPQPKQDVASETVMALVALGYQNKEAEEAVKAAVKAKPGVEQVEELLKLALHLLLKI